ncbi:protein male-specific lethal-1 [Anastrepha obliqua]|uniref:protein male-specific lethal-1 n=1 Tax=Anastrepha obliqua TaxID=95512 RepID=UPI002409D2C6|nr:protein male-specific lethal-1 [Anastrepha obliqua]
MENKCNKTPNTNSKYMDHVYCHPTESKNYIRANNNAGGGGGAASAANTDYLALLKENKQLRAMLILHLDLIQAQSDQLQVKDKQLATQNEELDGLRTKNQQLEVQVQDLQKQLQRHIKRTALSPPPLAKIQRKTEPILTSAVSPATAAATVTTSSTQNIIGECNGKLISKIILHRVSLPEHSPSSTTTGSSDTTSEADDSTASKTHAEQDDNDDDEPGEEEEDGDIEETGETTGNTTEDSSDVVAVHSKSVTHQRMSPVLVSRGAKTLRQLAMTPVTNVSVPVTTTSALSGTPALATTVSTTATTTQVCVTPPTPSRGKQMPLMLWHAPDIQSDESASCESLGELSDQRSMIASPASPKVGNQSNKPKNSTITHSLRSGTHLQSQQRQKSRRCAYISTAQMYCTRAWEDEEVVADGYEFMKEEAEALQADAPMLEIPKWTEHELAVSYCIEGTENLSDETFLKRHEKLELAEKRRKKWDVQQIREQRRIEKLKRRHCKDEIQIPPEQQPLLSFYPQPDTIQTICFTIDLPVQAFGELVPKLSAHNEFDLPWLEAMTSSRTPGSAATGSIITLAQSQAGANPSSAQGQQQLMNSTFVFVKKRKRQQSGTAGGTGVAQTARQRGALRRAAAAVAQTTNTIASAPPETIVTTQPATTDSTPPNAINAGSTPTVANNEVSNEDPPK